MNLLKIIAQEAENLTRDEIKVWAEQTLQYAAVQYSSE